MTKCIYTLIKSTPNFNAVFVKDLALNCLLFMIENWKESLDQVGHYDALLTDMLKAFDCIMQDLRNSKHMASIMILYFLFVITL